MLGEETNTQPRVLAHETLGRLELAGQQLQHRCLTSTVWPNNTNTRIELDIEFDILEELILGGISKGDLGHLYNRRGQFLDLRELEMYGILALRFFQNWHSFQFLDSRLRFGRLGSVVPELVDEG